MLSYAEDTGRIGPGSNTVQLVETTSGNTGLALAMVLPRESLRLGSIGSCVRL